MPDRKADYAKQLRKLDRWIAEQERDGWQSPAVKAAAEQVRLHLWPFAHTKTVSPVQVQALGEVMAALEAAKADNR